MDYWSEINEKDEMPMLRGVITIDSSDDPASHIINDEQEVRICLELSYKGEFFSFRSDRVKFFGKVSDGEFGEAINIRAEQ